MPPRTGTDVRVLVVEDHAVVRAGLKMLIESRAGMMVVGEARGAREAVELAAQCRPDVVLLDLDLGDHSGLDFIAAIQNAAPQSKILVLTGSRNSDTYQEASGLLFADRTPKFAIEAIYAATTGNPLAKTAIETTTSSPRAIPPPDADEEDV